MYDYYYLIFVLMGLCEMDEIKTNKIVSFSEPELPSVYSEDKVVVRNVLYAAKMCLRESNQLENWSVVVQDKSYVLNMYFAADSEVDINVRDLNTIVDVNPLRVLSVSIVKIGNCTLTLRAVVGNKDHPLMLTETDVVRIRKRSRFL